MSNRETIQCLQKAVDNFNYIVRRQNEEIRELNKQCETLNRIIDDKKDEIRRLKYQVKKYQKMAGVEDVKED